MKNIFIICYLFLSALLIAEEVTVSYPKNKVDFHFYKDLEEGRYLGSYIDLLNDINKDNTYTFKYKLAEDTGEDIQLRKIGSFSSKYYYLETPYTQKVFIIGNKDTNIEDILKKEKLQLGCLGVGLEELNKLQVSYGLPDSESVTFFRSEVDAYYALQNNKIDVLAVLNFKQNNVYSDVKILKVANMREYIGVKKDKIEIFKQLKTQLNSLSRNNEEILHRNIKNRKDFFTYLYKNLNTYDDIKKNYKTIKVFVPSKDFLPYFKKKLFKTTGIVPYLMKNIEEFLEIPIEYVFSEDADWDIQAVDFSHNDETMSREFFRTKLAGINHIYDTKLSYYKHLNNMTIIKLKDMDLNVALDKIDYKDIVEVNSLEEAFSFLREGKGNVILGPYFLLNHYLLFKNYDKEFKISQSQFEIAAEMTFKDEQLKDILNDLLLSYTADEIEYISNTSIQADKPINIVLIVTDILVVALVIFIAVFIKTHLVKRKLKEFINLFIRIEDINKMKDDRSLFHARNVSILSRLIAEEMKFRRGRITTIEKLGLVHDIGLVFIPKEIIFKKKTGFLSDREEEIFREHIKMGALLLKGIGISSRKRKIIKYHHENLDGSGYLGISGKAIPIESRILRATDIYDRIVSWKNDSHEDALNFLEKYKGTHFDPTVVDIIFKLQDKFKDVYTIENQSKDIDLLLKEFEEILAK